MTEAQKYVERRYPEADVWEQIKDDRAFYTILDDPDQNDDKIIILGKGKTEEMAWLDAARNIGSKR